MSAMTPAQELQQMYAGILPSLMDIQEATRAKRPPDGALDNQQQPKLRRSRAKGQGKGKATDHQDSDLGHHQQLQAVASLLLRHDAQPNRLAQDTTVLCTFTNKPCLPQTLRTGLPAQEQPCRRRTALFSSEPELQAKNLEDRDPERHAGLLHAFLPLRTDLVHMGQDGLWLQTFCDSRPIGR